MVVVTLHTYVIVLLEIKVASTSSKTVCHAICHLLFLCWDLVYWICLMPGHSLLVLDATTSTSISTVLLIE
jgi:hypothetical protein